jgi:hypothetical protein
MFNLSLATLTTSDAFKGSEELNEQSKSLQPITRIIFFKKFSFVFFLKKMSKQNRFIGGVATY